MRTDSIAQRWEDLNAKRQRAASQQLAAQRAAAYQAVRAQAGGLPSLTSMNATLPACEPQYLQDSRSGSCIRQDDMPELDTRDDGPPQYREQAPLTPPASDAGTHQEDGDGDGNELIRKLQEEVVQNGRRIQRLESELESEKGNRNRLQAERHEAVALQRQAAEGEEIRKMKQQIANLDDLLNGSIKRQKELESELDLCRQESHELKRRLHEERDVYESEIRARETRERLDRQQVEYENEATGAGIGRQRGQDGFGGVMMEGEVRGTGSSGYDGAGQRGGTNTVGIDASGRSRRDSRGTAGRAYVSIPKRGNRRALWMLS